MDYPIPNSGCLASLLHPKNVRNTSDLRVVNLRQQARHCDSFVEERSVEERVVHDSPLLVAA
jgi:hypothetical protein